MRDKNRKLVGCSAKEDGTNEVHKEGVAGRTLSPNIHNGLVVTVEEEFLAFPEWTPQEAGKSYGVELLPLDGAVRQVGGPGTIEPATLKVDAKAKTPRGVGEELKIRRS